MDLKGARKNKGQNQEEAARRLGVTQAYLSLLERGLRKPSPKLAHRLVREYSLPLTVLPLQDEPGTAKSTPEFLAEELGVLGYPGFSHLRIRHKKLNPANYLLKALSQDNLEARVAEALPWLALKYDLDFQWLVPEARKRNLQNRLGFTVTLARKAGGKDSLLQPELELEDSKLQKQDSYCKVLSPAEVKWLAENRSDEAKQWNLLTDLNPSTVRYATSA
jgi:transcriptional regulator with XRE-family HTH domain